MSKVDIIDDLQARLAFQEDLLSSLNSRVAKQDKELISFKLQIQHLNKKIEALGPDDTDLDANVPPPHY